MYTQITKIQDFGMNYSEYSIDQLLKEIIRFDKKLNKVKTQGGLWALEIGIKSVRSELDKRIKDPDKVTKMILEFEK